MAAEKEVWSMPLRLLRGSVTDVSKSQSISEAEIELNKRLGYLVLKKMTDLDFGYDADKWEPYLEAHPECIKRTTRGEHEQLRSRYPELYPDTESVRAYLDRIE